jgi:DNA-binding response OmpR family regulator
MTTHQNPPNGKRIIVIDPSRIIRTLLTINLQQAGHLVLTAATALEGLEMLKGLQSDPPDILFLAMHTHQQHEDFEVLRFIQRHPLYHHLPLILMMTQEDSERGQLRQLVRHHPTCLIKPFQMCEVLDLVPPVVRRTWEVR